MKTNTLKQSWSEAGKFVDGGEKKGGWFIFIHTENTKSPNTGYVQKWSFVVTTDMKYCFIGSLIEEERVPKCFSSEKKARLWWKENKDGIIKMIHDLEDEPFNDFDKYEVNICKGVIGFSIIAGRK